VAQTRRIAIIDALNQKPEALDRPIYQNDFADAKPLTGLTKPVSITQLYATNKSL
jgi:hypothetical protein